MAMMPPIEVPISTNLSSPSWRANPARSPRLIGVAVGSARRPGALAVAAHIEGEDAIAVLEMPGERVERIRTRGVAVHADDRRRVGLAPFEIVQGELVDPQGLAQGLHRGRHGGHLSLSVAPVARLLRRCAPRNDTLLSVIASAAKQSRSARAPAPNLAKDRGRPYL